MSTESKPSKWITVPDSKVRHIWVNDCGTEIEVSPTFYADSGTPIDASTGDDLTYVRTEICG
jgi:hypothetical protein